MLAITVGVSNAAIAQSTYRLNMRGREQLLRLYGPADGTPVIVSSGDGGWIHLAPHVAELLASRGFFVVGFDARAYLADFTAETATLRAADEARDFTLLTAFASARTGRKPLLIGVSEGAGLSVLAATDPDIKPLIAGVIALGLPERNELGWRWKDSLTYLTHRVPNEPTFSAAAMVAAAAPVPLAFIQSTHDEFVPLADTRRIVSQAAEPKRLWLVEATNHRFSSNLAVFDARLLEAIAWVHGYEPR
jgi:alpha-beta hydrolase superfamily lysophospholipase